MATLLPDLVAQEANRSPHTTLIQVDRLVVAPGTVLEGDAARLVIRDGKIAAIGAEIPAAMLRGAKVIKHSGTAVPGFVAPHGYLSQSRDLAERIDAFTPELMAMDAFDPFDDQLIRLARGGITSVCLAPSSLNTFGGLAAVVKWNGEEGIVTLESSYLKLALDASLNRERKPTSRMGAADMIRNAFEQANAPLSGTNAKSRVLKDALAGSHKVAIHASNHAELTTALDLCHSFGLRPILIGALESRKSLKRMTAMGVSVILAPLSFTSRRADLELPAALHKAGIPFSFTASHPEQLRVTVALAVRHGLSRQAALAALTETPSQQCGIADKTGSLRKGKQADLLIFAGDPIDLQTKLSAVYIGGNKIDMKNDAEAGR